jgi:hypothetical protein
MVDLKGCVELAGAAIMGYILERVSVINFQWPIFSTTSIV